MSLPGRRRVDFFVPATTCVFAALVLWQILVPPFIGLANNGDYPRVLGAYSLGPDRPHGYADDFRFFVADYIRDPRYFWESGVPSSERLLAAPSAWVAEVNRGRLDIRWHGMVHFVFLLTAFIILSFALRNEHPVIRWSMAAYSILVLSDVRYTAHLNSFYSDTPAFLGLALSMAAACLSWKYPQRALPVAVFVVGMLLLMTSKTQHTLIGFLGGSLLIWRAVTSRSWGLAGAGAVLLATSVWYFAHTRPGYNALPLFSVVFARLLPESADRATAAAELGVRPQELQYVGMHAYVLGSPLLSPEYQLDFARRVTVGRVALFYLRRPSWICRHAWSDLTVWAPIMRHQSLSNFQEQDGHPPGALTQRFASWTNLRSWLLRVAPWHIILLMVCLACLSLLWIRAGETNAGILMLALLLATVFSFATAVFLDATETNRHLGLFHALTDCQFGVALLALLRWSAKKPAPLAGGEPALAS